MNTLTVALGERSYPIHIGTGLLARGELLKPHLSGRQVMIVTNNVVAPLYLKAAISALDSFEVHNFILPDGESFKTLESLQRIFDALMAVPCDRDTTILALGGGVIGDIAGFAAACYQRGIGLIQIPTTLLAQVDSSVGGKTAVNHPRGKNMIGAFYQPRAVIADIDTLRTLPDRELRAGLAEVIKYGLIRDREFFDWLENSMASLLNRDAAALEHAVERSCRNKAAVVAADERERGERALLNLGHTFGHAIETATGYRDWLHGEAVAAGMVMAARVSLELGNLTHTQWQRVRDVVAAAGLPTRPPHIEVDDFLGYMAVDKKAAQGRVRLVLLRDIGDAYLSADYSPVALLNTLKNADTAA